MNPADPLAQLHPLRDPAAIGWWPLAPGWWLLLALLLAGLALAIWWLLRRYRRNAYRRRGTRALQSIRLQWQDSGNAAHCLGQANALLKAVALQAYPQREVAAASGANWQQFLNAHIDNQRQFTLSALESQYQANVDGVDLEDHLDLVAHWIAHHRVDS